MSINYFNYFSEIEDTFVRRRGKHLFLSPLDWAMMDEWQGRGIPLHIVLRAVDAVFDIYDKQPPGTRTIKSLFYCREEVEAQFAEWQRSQTGKSADGLAEISAEFDTSSILRHIDDVTGRLAEIRIDTLKDDIDRAVTRLNDLRQDLGDDPETAEKALENIEKMLDRSILLNWDGEHLSRIEAELANQLKPYKKEMEADKYKRTFELMLLRRLRDEAGVPRLGLYYV